MLPSDLSPIDPQRVPGRRLASGAAIPGIGMGTFGSDHVSAEAVGRAVEAAASLGYRHFDCAAVYGNEKEVGRALRNAMSDGVDRESLWITSKLWNDRHAPADVIPAFEESLRDLGLEYLDLFLVHWPFPNFHPPGCDVSSRSPEARPYRHEAFMATWRELEKLVERGRARHIGTSNMTIPKLELLLAEARIPPAVNEMELHPHFQQPELMAYLKSKKIQPVGYCPLGSPGRPERDRAPDDSSPLEDPVVLEIAQGRELHPAAVCLKWAAQNGQVPIPFSANPRNLRANLQAVAGEPLDAEEMRALAGIDRNCRLIKGQVFLWREGQSWEDLWDLHGRIAR